jgi:ribonuclease J
MEQLNEIEMWKPTAIAGFRVTPYLVDHSAPDAVAYVVETDQKKLFYSGDFRGHGRKSVLFQRMVSNPVQDVDCLLLEGTMLGRKEGDYPTEADVEEGFKKIIESSDSYTFILSSSQNLDRLVSAYRAAIRSDAMFVIDLYTAFVLDRLKVISANIPQADWPNVRVLYTHYHAEKLAQVDRKHLYRFVGSKINQDEMRSHSGRSVVFYRDNRYFRQMLGNLGDLTGARTVYSMWPGYLEGSGLEEALLSHRMDLSIVHTSGHAVESDLKRLVSALDPGCVVPMHTFHPGEYQNLFGNVVQLDDGEEFSVPVDSRKRRK